MTWNAGLTADALREEYRAWVDNVVAALHEHSDAKKLIDSAIARDRAEHVIMGGFPLARRLRKFLRDGDPTTAERAELDKLNDRVTAVLSGDHGDVTRRAGPRDLAAFLEAE